MIRRTFVLLATNLALVGCVGAPVGGGAGGPMSYGGGLSTAVTGGPGRRHTGAAERA